MVFTRNGARSTPALGRASARRSGAARLPSKRPLAADAGADALYSGAEVVGGDGEGGELVGGYPLLEVAQVYRAAHTHQGGLTAEGLQVGARVAPGVLGYVLQVEVGRSEERRVGKECRSRWS